MRQRRKVLLIGAGLCGLSLGLAALWAPDGVRARLREIGVLSPRTESRAYRRLVAGHVARNPELPAGCVLLLGDSLTAVFPPGLSEPRRWVNRGISGDRVRDVRKRLGPSALEAPCQTVSLLIGSNDIVRERAEPEEVARGIRGIVEELVGAGRGVALATLPPTRGPFEEFSGAVRQTNERLRQAPWPTAVRLVDLHAALADDQGQLRSGYTTDGLHLKGAAFERWAKILAGMLAEEQGPRGERAGASR